MFQCVNFTCICCRDCLFDLCAEQGSEVLRCENYAVYARACQDEGVKLAPWRQQLGCGMTYSLTHHSHHLHHLFDLSSLK